MSDDANPDDLTSPGTVRDPALERERADEAAVREAESRASDETRFAQEREAQEARRRELAADLRDLDEPGDS